jgi:hypothetical protein
MFVFVCIFVFVLFVCFCFEYFFFFEVDKLDEKNKFKQKEPISKMRENLNKKNCFVVEITTTG